ncbi:uncharacterized protein C4orf17 homolog [Pipistrellus kuhlii]|uniref:Uncharacterized protein n=1 Tax=Pipistrellus kuhlii TaxID=59472 RepID=A0A7J8AXZ2_PIPKU|nr:uncharacterized protein C4orf17 homolog [Pipistrellus kuhlii]KAF6391413.1 hypothetical protein mPipKuh1_001841 [Pipistrellus kuhlii]
MSLKSSASTPQFESKTSHSLTRNGSYLVRHTPHPRRVCHIKGLNNIPICTVKDDDYSLRSMWSVDQFNQLEMTDNMPFAKCSHPPSTAAQEGPVRGVSPAPKSANVHPPRPHSAPCRKIKECFKTSNENPLVIKKESKVKDPPLPPMACLTMDSCSPEVMNTKTNTKENTIRIPNYLDQEIKILAKLCNILHTDSLTEVLQWLLHASSKEKEWVSALIHAELSEINLMARPLRRSVSAEPAVLTGKLTKVKPSTLPVKSKVLTRPREEHQLTRVSSQEFEENKVVPKEAEHKPAMFIRRNKMTIPVTEYFSKSNSPPRPKTQENVSTKPMSARSIHQEYNPSPQRTFSPLTYQR